MPKSKTGSIKKRIVNTGKRLARNLHTLQIMKPLINESVKKDCSHCTGENIWGKEHFIANKVQDKC